MDVCQLTKHWCVMCGSHPEGQVCYEGAQILKIKDLRACPQLPFKTQDINRLLTGYPQSN